MSEAGHPIDGTPARIATVDPARTCNIIKRMWRDGNLIRGSIETLDDGMLGTKLTKGILQGINPSYSYRGFAVLDKKGNISYVNKPPRYITHDEVVLPSHKEAYAEPKKVKVAQSYTGEEFTFDEIKKAIRKYPEAYYLQTDIRKFYQTIDHNLCKAELEKYIKDAKCLKFFSKLIDNNSIIYIERFVNTFRKLLYFLIKIYKTFDRNSFNLSV